MKKVILPLLLFAAPALAADLESSRPLGPEKTLKVRLSLRDGAFRLRGTEADLYRLQGKGEAIPRLVYRPGLLELSVPPSHRPSAPSYLLHLTQKMPLTLQGTLGKQWDLELGGLRLSEVDLDTGVSKTKVSFSTPNPIPLKRFSLKAGASSLQLLGLGNANFERFTFEGGAGRYLLDFRGNYRRKGKVKIELGIGQATVLIPKSVGIRLATDNSLLSNLSLPEFYRGGEEKSPNYETAEGTIDLQIHCGVGSSLQLLWK